MFRNVFSRPPYAWPVVKFRAKSDGFFLKDVNEIDNNNNNNNNNYHISHRMEDAIDARELKENCMKSLAQVGASDEVCTFFADALQCEYEMNTTVYRLKSSLAHNGKFREHPAKLLQILQELTKCYNKWRHVIEALVEKGNSLPPLEIDRAKLCHAGLVTALCSVETNEIKVKEGDELFVVDTSHPEKFKVRTSGGQEGFIPALCCILPSPDKDAPNTAERLRVQLLVSWTETVRKTQSILRDCVSKSAKQMVTDWVKHTYHHPNSDSTTDRLNRRFRRILNTINRDSPTLDLTRLHGALFSVENELIALNTEDEVYCNMTETVATLDKAVLCYQVFRRHWSGYSKLMQSSSSPIEIVEHITQLRPDPTGMNIKYYEVKMIMEKTETLEEIVHLTKTSETMTTSDYESQRQMVKTDQITSVSNEENRRYIIRGVLDPASQRQISLDAAVASGVVDPQRGVYVDVAGGTGMPIGEAMSAGLISVDFSTSRRTRETTTAVGLITIRTTVDHRPYSVSLVTDASTGERVGPEEACRRDLLDEARHTFRVATSGEVLDLDVAVQRGWVTAVYRAEDGDPTVVEKMYAVHHVVDQRRRKKIPFYEAVNMGLIDRQTGSYINNVTREKVYVADAIRRGFLKATAIDDTTGMDFDAENHIVIEKVEKIRKKLLRPISIIRAFRKGVEQESSTGDPPLDTAERH